MKASLITSFIFHVKYSINELQFFYLLKAVNQ